MTSIPTPNRSTRNRGFSLVEILVVLSVISIILAFTAPSLLTLRSTGLSTSAREFSNFVNLCRTEAIARRTSIRLGIVVESDSPEEAYVKYAAWEWDKETLSYRQSSQWKFLTGSVFDPGTMDYALSSEYVADDLSLARSDKVLEVGGEGLNEQDILFSTPSEQDEEQEEYDVPMISTLGMGESGGLATVRFISFSPSGTATMNSEGRNMVIAIRELSGDIDRANPNAWPDDPQNWALFITDTLTGRTRTVRPQ